MNTKTFDVVYNISAVTGGATEAIEKLANQAQRLSNRQGLDRFNQQLRYMTELVTNLNTQLKSLSPKVDMRMLKTQLKLMEQAVGQSAQTIQSMMSAALSGNGSALSKAMKGKGSWATMIRSGLEEQEKHIKKELKAAQKNVEELRRIVDSGKMTVAGVGSDGRGGTRSTTSSVFLSQEDMKATKQRLRAAEQMYSSYQNQLSSIKTNLAALGKSGKEAAAAMAGVNVSKESAANAEKLNSMAQSISKWNKTVAKMPKTQTYKISLNAVDGVSPIIKAINEKLAVLKSEAASIFIGGAPTTKTTGKGTSGTRQPKPTIVSQTESLTKSIGQLQGIADKNGVRIGTKLDRSGLLARAKSGYETMQKLSSGRPIILRSHFDGSGAGFEMSRSIVKLQELANARKVVIRSHFDGSGAAFEMSRSLGKLQSLANGKGVKSLAVDITGRITRVINAVKNRPTISVNGKITPVWGGIKGKAEAISKINDKIPPIKLLLDTAEAKAKLQEFIALIKENSTQRINLQAGASKTGAVSGGVAGTGSKPMGTRMNPVITRNVSDSDIFNRTKRWAYPLTGNTSYGARTPAIVEMAKGMGMMFAIGGAMSGVSNSFRQSADYQNMMTTTRAILSRNYSGNNFDRDFSNMEKVVRAEGVATKFTAPEVAGAAKYLAMAGMDIDRINKAINPVVNIALAGDMDLPTTADKMTNIMTAFGLKSNQDFVRTSDILANTFTKSNTSMLQLAESAQYAAPIASARGMSLAEMMALVGVMGDAGIQGSMAGTSLRMMMNNIYNPSKSQQKMWDSLAKLGVNKKDKSGNWLGVSEILNQIASVVPEKDLPDVMGKLFRVTSVAGATQLARNIGRVNELRRSNESASGVATSMREARINNVQGKWAQVTSTFTEGMLKVFEKPESQEKIMKMLDRFRELLAKPETAKSMENLFDLMLTMVDFMGRMANVAMSIYNIAPDLIKGMLKFQMIMTMIGGYIITPIVRLLTLAGTYLAPLLGLGAGGRAIATSRMALGGGGAALATGLAAGGASVAGSSARLAAGRAATLGGAYALANSRAVRYDQIANRLNYGIEQQYLSNPDNRQPIIWMSHARNRAVAKAAAQRATAANLASRMAPVTRADALARYQRIYGRAYNGSWWGRTAAGAGRAINAGMAAGSFASVFGGVGSMIKGGLSTVITGLSRGLGMLISPVGLATTAIAALGYGAYKTVQLFKESREKRVALENNAIARGNEHINRLSASINSVKDEQFIKDMGGRIRVIQAPKNVPSTTNRLFGRVAKKGAAINTLKEYSPLYKDFTNDSVRHMNISEQTSILYDKYIAPYTNVIDGKVKSKDEFIKEITGRALERKQPWEEIAGNVNPNIYDPIRNAAALTSIYAEGANSKRAKEARDKILNLLSQNGGRMDMNFKANAMKIIEEFNPSNWRNLNTKDASRLTYAQIGQSTDFSEFSQYYAGIYNHLMGMLNDPENKYTQMYQGITEINNGVMANTLEWSNAVSKILNNLGTTFFDLQGNAHKVFMNFNKFGKPDWAGLHARLKELNIDWANSMDNHINQMIRMISDMYNMPELEKFKGLLGRLIDILRGEIMKEEKSNALNIVSVAEKLHNRPSAWVPTSEPAYGVGPVVPGHIDWNMMGGPFGIDATETESEKNIKRYGVLKGSAINRQRYDEMIKDKAHEQGVSIFDGLTSSIDQSPYRNRYGQGAVGKSSSPVIVIENLANFSGTSISGTADERDIAQAMENKIANAIGLLSEQYVPLIGASAEGQV